MADVNFNLKLAIDEFKAATAEATNLTKGLSNTVNTQTKSMSNSWGVFVGGLQLEVFKKAAGFIKDIFTTAIDEAAQAEESVNNLNIALRSSGNYSKQASEDLQAFAASLQATTVYSDDAILGVMNTLEAITDLDKEGLQSVTKSVVDFAAKYGKGLDEASSMVARALEGNVVAFNKMGIRIKEGSTEAERLANVMQALSTAQGAAEQKTNTYTGAMAQAKNQLGEVFEAAGGIITQNPNVIAAINAGAKAFSDLATNVKEAGVFINENKDILISLATGITAVAAGYGIYIAATSAATASTIAFTTALLANPFTWIAIGIAAVISGIVLLVRKWDEVKLATLNFVKSTLEALAPLEQALNKMFGLDVNVIKSSLDSVNSKILETKAILDKKNNPVISPEETEAARKEAEQQAAIAKQKRDERLKAEADANAGILQLRKQNSIDIAQAEKDGMLAMQQEQSAYNAQRLQADLEASNLSMEQKNAAHLALIEQRALQQEEELLALQAQEQAKLAITSQAEMDKALLIQDSNNRNKAIAEAQTKADLNRVLLANKQSLDMQKLHNSNQSKIEAERTTNQREENKLREANQRDTFATIATMQNSNNRTLAIIGKAAALTQIAIDTPVAIGKALAAFPPPANFIAAGAVGAAMAVQAAKVAGVGNFENGGIIPGQSFTGDRLQANVNSGEMILNRSQQKELFDIANGGGSTGLIDAINSLGERMANMEIKLFTNDTLLATSVSRGVADGVVLGVTR